MKAYQISMWYLLCISIGLVAAWFDGAGTFELVFAAAIAATIMVIGFLVAYLQQKRREQLERE